MPLTEISTDAKGLAARLSEWRSLLGWGDKMADQKPLSGMPSPEQLESLFMGEVPRYTPADVAALAGVPIEFAKRVWRMLGFPDVAEETVAFTDADVRAMKSLQSMIDRDLLDEQTGVRMARAMGQSLSRLAQAQVEILAEARIEPDTPLSDEAITQILEVTRILLPEVEDLLVHVWRVQLTGAANRALTIASLNDEMNPSRVTLCVGFVDLVSFTQLSRELDEKELAELVEGFETTATDIVASRTARVVKTLGDEVMFMAVDPVDAADIALRLSEMTTGLDVRVGVAYGPVLPMMGDLFGSTVNLAARLTGIARPGTILIDASLADTLSESKEFGVSRIRRRPARGFGIIQPYVLKRALPASGPH